MVVICYPKLRITMMKNTIKNGLMRKALLALTCIGLLQASVPVYAETKSIKEYAQEYGFFALKCLGFAPFVYSSCLLVNWWTGGSLSGIWGLLTDSKKSSDFLKKV